MTMQPLITEMDERRLRNLLSTPIARKDPVAARFLRYKLDRARVVPSTAVPSTVATMNSKLSCWDPAKGETREISLVYPWAYEPAEDRFSILSRVGVDLLGAIPGRRVFIDGTPWEILYVAYQPEAQGSFHL